MHPVFYYQSEFFTDIINSVQNQFQKFENFTSEKDRGCCRTPQWVIGYFGRDKKPRIRLFSMGSKMVSSPSQITEVSEIFKKFLINSYLILVALFDENQAVQKSFGEKIVQAWKWRN